MSIDRPRSRRRTPGLALIALLVSGGCGDAASDDPASGLDDAPLFDTEVALRIGDVEDPDLGFSRIGAVAVAPDGRVFAVEAQDLEIRVFGPDGELQGTMGRRGEGPGEFQNSPRIGVVGDTVWAYEGFIDRLTLFRTDGTLIHTRRMEIATVPLSGGSGTLSPVGVDDAGRLVGALNGIRYSREEQSEPTRPDSVPRVAYDWEGQPSGTVGWDPGVNPRVSPPPGHDSDFRTIRVDGRPFTVPPAPTTLPWWEHTGDGLFILDAPPATVPEGDVFRVTRLDMFGDTLFHREIAYIPEPYTEAALDSIAEQSARSGGRFRLSGQAPEEPENWQAIAARMRAEMKFPALRAPVDWGWADADDRLWLRAPTSPDADTRRWIRLSAEGEIDGALLLSASVQPKWAEGDDLWVSEPDELGVQWLVQYRVGEPGAGSP